MSDIIHEEEVEQSSLTTILVTHNNNKTTEGDEIVNVELAQESPPIVDNLAQSRKVRKNQLLLQPSLMMKHRNKQNLSSMTPTQQVAAASSANDFPLANHSASKDDKRGKQTAIAPVSMVQIATARPSKQPGTVPSKHKTVAEMLIG